MEKEIKCSHLFLVPVWPCFCSSLSAAAATEHFIKKKKEKKKFGVFAVAEAKMRF